MGFWEHITKMETVAELFVGLVVHALPLLLLPLLFRIYRQHKEQKQMIARTLFENTGVTIFGEFDGKVQSEFLGDFLTTLFGERIFDLVVSWNDDPSPNVIVPRSDYEAGHMAEILTAKASAFILQSNHLDPYFTHAKVYGTEHYKFCKVVVALARPDAHKLISHDYPRVIAIELSALQRILDNSETLPQWETQDGYTWLTVLRELGQKYSSGDHNGLAILEFPLNSIDLATKS